MPPRLVTGMALLLFYFFNIISGSGVWIVGLDRVLEVLFRGQIQGFQFLSPEKKKSSNKAPLLPVF
jgi:hypothetical protein